MIHMNNKIYVVAFIVWVAVWLLVFMAIMLVYLKITTARLENTTLKIEQRVHDIYSIIDPERVNTEIEVLIK